MGIISFVRDFFYPAREPVGRRARRQTQETAEARSKAFWSVALNGLLLSSGIISLTKTLQGPKPQPLPPGPTPNIITAHRFDRDIAYRNISDATLFDVNGIYVDEVKQGTLDDSYFLASLASVAAQTPDLVRDHLRVNSNGTYSALLFYPVPGGAMQSQWVPVDPALPRYPNGTEVYARSTASAQGRTIWAPVFEKALAVFNDAHHLFGHLQGPGYNGLRAGSTPRGALAVLLGAAACVTPVDRGSVSRTWEVLQTAGVSSYVIASSRSRPFRGLQRRHAYTVLGARVTEAGVKMVSLRDPRGCCTPDAPQGGTGQFEITFDAFRRGFLALYAADYAAVKASPANTTTVAA